MTEKADIKKTGAVKAADFPIAPPQQTVFEATVQLSDRLQSQIHRLNEMGEDTGWYFALVMGNGKSDVDGITRMSSHGYEVCSKTDIEGLATYLGGPLPVQTNETLMRKPYKQFRADKDRAADLLRHKSPQGKQAIDGLDGSSGVRGEMVASTALITVSKPE